MPHPTFLQTCTHYLSLGGTYAVRASNAFWTYSEPYLKAASNKVAETFFRTRPFLESTVLSISQVISLLSIPVSIISSVQLYRRLRDEEGMARVLLISYQILIIASVVLNIILLTTAPEAQTLTFPLLTTAMGISFGLGAFSFSRE